MIYCFDRKIYQVLRQPMYYGRYREEKENRDSRCYGFNVSH